MCLILKVLPKGAKVVSATSWGTSAWTITGRVETILADGTPKTYFLKVRKPFFPPLITIDRRLLMLSSVLRTTSESQ
jgi:hypothetical protein